MYASRINSGNIFAGTIWRTVEEQGITLLFSDEKRVVFLIDSQTERSLDYVVDDAIISVSEGENQLLKWEYHIKGDSLTLWDGVDSLDFIEIK